MDEWPSINVDALGSFANSNVLQSQSTVNSVNGTFDPYQVMLNRKNRQIDLMDDNVSVVNHYSDNDVKELEEFCQQYGIFGFNCGEMKPKEALNLLKRKMGVIESAYNKKILYG